MKVINVAGFVVNFEKEGKYYRIPNDNKLHFIPDRCYFEDNFQGLLRVIVPPLPVKQVVKQMDTIKIVDINDPTIKEIVIEKIEEKNNKPLKGKRIKKVLREGLKKVKKIEHKETTVIEEIK